LLARDQELGVTPQLCLAHPLTYYLFNFAYYGRLTLLKQLGSKGAPRGQVAVGFIFEPVSVGIHTIGEALFFAHGLHEPAGKPAWVAQHLEAECYSWVVERIFIDPHRRADKIVDA